MKVTFCSLDWPDYVGGPNAWLRRLVPGLVKKGIQVKVLFFVDNGIPENCPTVMAFRDQGVDCPAICTPVWMQDRVRWILKKIQADPPDIFVPNLVLPAFYSGQWVREANIPTIGVLHSDDPYYYALIREFVFHKGGNQLSALVCVSKFLEQEVHNRHPQGTLIRRIPCGVPVPQQTTEPPRDRMRLIYTGRINEEQKRISDLTRALCRAVREVPDTEAVIYGKGPAESAVRQIIANEGKGLPITYAGSIDSDQVQMHLLKSQALVLLSDYEGLSVSVMEAMACGVVPIYLNTRSGAAELIEHEKTGLLVANRDDDFVNAVRRLRNEPSLWASLSSAARAKIEAEYSSDFSTECWAELLNELVGASKPKLVIKIPGRLRLPEIPADLAHGHPTKPPLLKYILRGGWRFSRRLVGRLMKNINHDYYLE
jgi:glycosyltransferase involved in cell wall biosynthesis